MQEELISSENACPRGNQCKPSQGLTEMLTLFLKGQEEAKKERIIINSKVDRLTKRLDWMESPFLTMMIRPARVLAQEAIKSYAGLKKARKVSKSKEPVDIGEKGEALENIDSLKFQTPQKSVTKPKATPQVPQMGHQSQLEDDVVIPSKTERMRISSRLKLSELQIRTTNAAPEIESSASSPANSKPPDGTGPSSGADFPLQTEEATSPMPMDISDSSHSSQSQSHSSAGMVTSSSSPSPASSPTKETPGIQTEAVLVSKSEFMPTKVDRGKVRQQEEDDEVKDSNTLKVGKGFERNSGRRKTKKRKTKAPDDEQSDVGGPQNSFSHLGNSKRKAIVGTLFNYGGKKQKTGDNTPPNVKQVVSKVPIPTFTKGTLAEIFRPPNKIEGSQLFHLKCYAQEVIDFLERYLKLYAADRDDKYEHAKLCYDIVRKYHEDGYDVSTLRTSEGKSKGPVYFS